VFIAFKARGAGAGAWPGGHRSRTDSFANNNNGY